MKPKFEFDAVIKTEPDMNIGYIEIPHEVCAQFNSGRVLVHASFDDEPYDGQMMRMGTPCHIIGVRKDIRAKIGKQPGDTIRVTITESDRKIRKPSATGSWPLK